jgi:hypothetical protein
MKQDIDGECLSERLYFRVFNERNLQSDIVSPEVCKCRSSDSKCLARYTNERSASCNLNRSVSTHVKPISVCKADGVPEDEHKS